MLIQPNFDYACAAWYPELNKKFLKNKFEEIRSKKFLHKECDSKLECKILLQNKVLTYFLWCLVEGALHFYPPRIVSV